MAEGREAGRENPEKLVCWRRRGAEQSGGALRGVWEAGGRSSSGEGRGPRARGRGSASERGGRSSPGGEYRGRVGDESQCSCACGPGGGTCHHRAPGPGAPGPCAPRRVGTNPLLPRQRAERASRARLPRRERRPGGSNPRNPLEHHGVSGPGTMVRSGGLERSTPQLRSSGLERAWGPDELFA